MATALPSRAGSAHEAPPLEGVLVVAVEQAVAAPFATRQLADLGARVIKVERPGEGDFARHYDHVAGGVSAYFAWLNRGKESVALDLKTPDDRELLERLLGHADVFVQNLAPGAAERLGLSAQAVQERHPETIACDLSGYGQGGPYAGRRAYDLLIQAETGVLSVTGTPEESAKAGISIADIAGGMYLLTGVLAGLYRRARTGSGTALHVSLFDALAEWMSQPWYLARYGPGPPARSGAHHATIAPYGPFRCGDGPPVLLGIQNEREWRRFCADVLDDAGLAERPEYATNEQRVAHRDALHDHIEAAFAPLSHAAVARRLDVAGIAHAVVRTPAELTSHPQVAGRDRLRVVDAPERPLDALLPPLRFPGPEPPMGAIPAVGEHTEQVRAWLEGAPAGA
jgi:crotonobetainyl-CoA:carnitine CoA-transferase CaiB-like acyl-CoA transferase